VARKCGWLLGARGPTSWSEVVVVWHGVAIQIFVKRHTVSRHLSYCSGEALGSRRKRSCAMCRNGSSGAASGSRMSWVTRLGLTIAQVAQRPSWRVMMFSALGK
jgi:hypothetical protein